MLLSCTTNCKYAPHYTIDISVHLDKKGAALCWQCESPTNQTIQLVYVTSFTHSTSTHSALSASCACLAGNESITKHKF